jgi:hypothetical protein
MAWALLAQLSHDEGSVLRVSGLRPTERDRVRERLETRPLGEWAPRLRSRARTLRLRTHPAYLERLAHDQRVVRTGVTAATDYGADITAPGMAELYAPARSIPALRGTYHLVEAEEPNAVIHVVDGPWPFRAGVQLAPRHVVALDLLDSDDERTRRAGLELLEGTSPG